MERFFAQLRELELTRKFAIPISILAFLVLLAFGIGSIYNKKQISPEQKFGILDLRYFKIKNNTQPISLNGEWQFYWQEFLISDPSSYTPEPVSLKTQETWSGKDMGTEIPGRNGYGTYSLNILLPIDEPFPKLGLFLPQIASSYRLYINRQLVHTSGIPSRERNTSKSYLKNMYLPISLSEWDKNIEIVLEVSNFDNEYPGFWGIPLFGSMESIHKINVFSTANDLFLFGALVIMGFYHWGIYFYHKSQKSILFFSAFAYLLALRVIVTGQRYILELFPRLDWEILIRLEYFGFFLLPMSFSIYMYYLFPNETKKNLVHCISAVTGVFTLFLFLPVHIITMSTIFFIVFIVIVAVYLIYVNIRAVLAKREDASLFLLGIVIIALTAFWDIYQDIINLRGLNLVPYGFLVFVFVQALVLSSRLASHFTHNEKLTHSLSKSNQQLTFLKRKLEDRVEERTKKLRDSIAVIRKDLDIAKNIQSKLIPIGTSFWSGLKISTIYNPMEEVGGDIFDIAEMEDGKIRIFLADALGHGVQAALLTMAIKSEYEGIKNISINPSDTIQNLSVTFLKKFSSLQTYFSAVVIDIDTKSNKLLFASAGHPDQLLLNEDGFVSLPRTAHIIGLDSNIQVVETEHHLQRGDRIYLYSDGAYEEFNQTKEIMGEDRLIGHFIAHKSFSLESSLESLKSTIETFLQGGRLQDDLTVIGIEIV